MTLYFDMDGTIADLYGIDTWLEDIQNELCRPYEEAKPLIDIPSFISRANAQKANGIKFGIISWTARGGSNEYNKAVRKAKLKWLNDNFSGIFTEIHIVKYGTPKYSVCKDEGILFDDDPRNREVWKGEAYTEKEIFSII